MRKLPAPGFAEAIAGAEDGSRRWGAGPWAITRFRTVSSAGAGDSSPGRVVVPVRCQSTTQEPLWVQLMIYSLCRSAGSWAPATVHHSTCASCSRPADGMDAGVAYSSGVAAGGGQSSGLEVAFTSVLVATPGAGS